MRVVIVVLSVVVGALLFAWLPIREVTRRSTAEAAASAALPQGPVPVALVALPVATPVDRRGDELAIDPARDPLDLPLLRVMSARTEALWGRRILARDLGTIAEVAPEVFAVLSEARIDDREAVLLLGDVQHRIRYRPPMRGSRLRAAIVALNDAIARQSDRIPSEVDLRFAEQVVVRSR